MRQRFERISWLRPPQNRASVRRRLPQAARRGKARMIGLPDERTSRCATGCSLAVAALALIGLSVALTQAQGEEPRRSCRSWQPTRRCSGLPRTSRRGGRRTRRSKRNNSRLFDGPTNISANVRIVAGEDPPLVHETTADLWIVTAGTAVARTDGKLVDSRRQRRNRESNDSEPCARATSCTSRPACLTTSRR